jgi:hypothetical protein
MKSLKIKLLTYQTQKNSRNIMYVNAVIKEGVSFSSHEFILNARNVVSVCKYEIPACLGFPHKDDYANTYIVWEFRGNQIWRCFSLKWRVNPLFYVKE